MLGYKAMPDQNRTSSATPAITIYANGPMKAEVELKDGSIWKNVMI